MKWIFFLLVIAGFLYAAFSPQSPFYSRFHREDASQEQGTTPPVSESETSQTSLESNILDTLENIKK